MNDIEKFYIDCANEIEKQSCNQEVKDLSSKFINLEALRHYCYHFTWLGMPIIQYPQDIIVMQELIFKTKPDLIIETGIARGGSLIFYGSMLELNKIYFKNTNYHVLGIDIDIREHNRKAIENHFIYKLGHITMLNGSSTDSNIISFVYKFASRYNNIMLVLDSNHSHSHVLNELNAYCKLVSQNSFIVVFDTVIEYMPDNAFSDRPWGKGNNPLTAVNTFLSEHSDFIIDNYYSNKSLITAAPSGFLRRVAK